MYLSYTFLAEGNVTFGPVKGFRETLQMEMLMHHHPVEVRALLVPSNYKMTARWLLDLFTINYSDSESQRCMEDQIVAHWRRYIVGLETEGMYIFNLKLYC